MAKVTRHDTVALRAQKRDTHNTKDTRTSTSSDAEVLALREAMYFRVAQNFPNVHRLCCSRTPLLPFPNLATTRVFINTPLPSSPGGLLRSGVPPNPHPPPPSPARRHHHFRRHSLSRRRPVSRMGRPSRAKKRLDCRLQAFIMPRRPGARGAQGGQPVCQNGEA